MTNLSTLSVTTLFTTPTFKVSKMDAEFDDVNEAMAYLREKPAGIREHVRGLFVSDTVIYFDHGKTNKNIAIKYFYRQPTMTDSFWQEAIEATQLNTTYFAQDEAWT